MPSRRFFLRALGVLCGLSVLFFASAFIFASPETDGGGMNRGAETPSGALPSFWDDKPHDRLSAEITDAMTDEELLAQIFMFGWAGEQPSKEVTAWVEERFLGNIKIFGWNTDNTEKVAEAVNFLQKKAENGRFKIPLFVATDQEGGMIRHIKGLTSETPGNLAIGASAVPADAYYSGYYIARELAALGINMNFAPTVDLYTNHESTVIGPRSFGEDPEAASVLGAAFAAGTRDAGVLATAKHFPGHGDTSLDSHGRLPVIDIDSETFYSRELVPFKALIAAGIPAVMSAHLSFPGITGSYEPATFSRHLLKTVLREQLGFKGMVVTDDIMMNGATQYAGSVSKAVELAIMAGNDIIESSTTPGFEEAFWIRNIRNMASDPEFRQQVKQAAARVIEMKLTYFKSGNAVPIYAEIDKIPEMIPAPGAEEFFLAQAARSVTLVYGGEHLPVDGNSNSILITGAFPEFRRAGKTRFPEADLALMNSGLLRYVGDYDIIIFAVSSEHNLAILNSLPQVAREDAKIIAVSLLSPVLLEQTEVPDAALAVYSYSPYSFEAVFSAIAGDYSPDGALPLKDTENMTGRNHARER